MNNIGMPDQGRSLYLLGFALSTTPSRAFFGLKSKFYVIDKLYFKFNLQHF
jgi:hypothetical protein